MPITINGSGTVTGISAGGLPDASIVTADIADANITAAKLDGAQSGSAPIYGCRAWVVFDGTGSTGTNQTIRGSGNVASVYKNGTGDYTITFTTAMPDANYVSNMTASRDGSSATFANLVTSSAASVRLETVAYTSASVDRQFISVAIFR